MALTFSCPCFNVELVVKEGEGRVVQPQDNDSMPARDAFFQNVQILEATNGITVNKKLECLCHSRRVDEWIITRCVNCMKETHAVSTYPHKSNTCYFSLVMMVNATTSILPKLKDYSTVYNIVIQSQPLSAVGEYSTASSVSSAKEQSAKQLQEINAKVTNYLDAERALMNERIRLYENEQKQTFNLLESKAWQDHNALAEIVNSHQSSSKPIGTNNQVASAKDVNNSKTSPFGIKAPADHQHQSAKHFATKRATFRPQRSTEESMFMMDEDEEGNGDDEERVFESSDDDSAPVAGRTSGSATAAADADAFKLFATSLPISMPGVWQKSRHLQNPAENFGEYDLEESPTKRDCPVEGIAASIKALAMSVRGDGTEMFGARPRPRLNTLD